MKGQKVYIVTQEIVDEGVHDNWVRVFAEIKEAQECFNESVQLSKEENNDNWKEDESDGYYESWIDGYYDNCHVVIRLDEKEVE